MYMPQKRETLLFFEYTIVISNKCSTLCPFNLASKKVSNIGSPCIWYITMERLKFLVFQLKYQEHTYQILKYPYR